MEAEAESRCQYTPVENHHSHTLYNSSRTPPAPLMHTCSAATVGYAEMAASSHGTGRSLASASSPGPTRLTVTVPDHVADERRPKHRPHREHPRSPRRRLPSDAPDHRPRAVPKRLPLLSLGSWSGSTPASSASSPATSTQRPAGPRWPPETHRPSSRASRSTNSAGSPSVARSTAKPQTSLSGSSLPSATSPGSTPPAETWLLPPTAGDADILPESDEHPFAFHEISFGARVPQPALYVQNRRTA